MLTNLTPGYYLGIDGGGTKTQAVISAESGFIVGRGTAGGANPHNLPMETVVENLKSAIEQARNNVHEQDSNRSVDSFEVACLGLAGIDTPADRIKVNDYFHSLQSNNQGIGAKKLILCNDGLVSLKSGTDKNWGISMIASTGSNCYGLSRSGREASAGDWGYILGDQGSGYAMGLKIIREIVKEYDGRKPRTILTSKVLEHLHLEETPDLVNWVYSGKVPVRDIASLSQLLNDPSLTDSLDLQKIVTTTIEELLNAYKAVVNRLNFHEYESFPVVFTGGLFSMRERFANKVMSAIKDFTAQAEIIIPTNEPAEGAIKVALLGNELKLFPDSVVTFINPN